jgi:aminoglycoside phosphotransferase (APT) family kinase protein
VDMAILAPDIKITPDTVTTVLREQFNINVNNLNLLYDGLSNFVYLVDNDLVFKFPKRDKAALLVLREITILPAIKKVFSLKIPEPKYLGKPSKTFSRSFYGSELIYGYSGCSIRLTPSEYEQLTLDLARFLKKLHQIRPRDLGLTSNFDSSFDRTNKNRMIRDLENRLSCINKYYDLNCYCDKFDNIKTAALNYQQNARKTFIHGDLYHRHILFDDSHNLCGIIDWGECCVGDPVADLGIVFQFLPKTCHETFFAEYGYTDEICLDYARFLGLYYAVALLWYGHDRNDQDLIRTSLWTFNEL